LRLLYTVPDRYASPEEGWLSFGIKSIQIPPLCWNSCSPLKRNLLIVILGYEEIRAWSLIDRFSSDLKWIYLTYPGSKPEWNDYCEKYNRRLLEAIPPKGKISALDPNSVEQVLSRDITTRIGNQYNIFICSLGTKIQLISTLDFCMNNAAGPNLITTTAVDHNVPYYSWGIGKTYEFFYPLAGGKLI
jgi:hypothetical protein